MSHEFTEGSVAAILYSGSQHKKTDALSDLHIRYVANWHSNSINIEGKRDLKIDLLNPDNKSRLNRNAVLELKRGCCHR